MESPLRCDLAPATLLRRNNALRATAQNPGHHSGDGDSEEDLTNELHGYLLRS
jgi:hypothetical protein